MTWEEYIFDFKTYLQLERSLSENTVNGYVSDVELLRKVVNGVYPKIHFISVRQQAGQEEPEPQGELAEGIL